MFGKIRLLYNVKKKCKYLIYNVYIVFTYFSNVKNPQENNYEDYMTSHYNVYKMKPLRHQNNNCFSVKHYHNEIITSNNTIIKRVKLSATLAL